MKNIKIFFTIGLLATLSSLFYSCNDDEVYTGSGSQPEISSVSLATTDVETTVGSGGNMYIIRGVGFATLKNIYFNDFDTYFNSTLVTDNVIFVTIDKETPYDEDAIHKLRIVTKYGETEYDFTIAPPVPSLKSFQPVNAADGEEFTIYGNYYVNPVVKVGGTEATIVSYTLTEIVAVMPPNSNGKYVTVETLSGIAEWGTAVGTAIYDDNFYGAWNIEEWNNHVYVTNLEDAFQGVTFFKKDISGWDNIQSNWVWDDQISQYTGIKLAVRSDDEGKLELIFNGDWSDATERQFTTTKEWKEVKFTWEQLGNPTQIQNITFKEFTGSTHTYYFDNITFTVD